MAKEQQQHVVKYTTEKGDTISLNPKMVRSSIAFGGYPPTDAEVVQFMMLCKSFRLNPWLREVYLIKYGTKDPATTVLGKDLFNKRATNHPKYDGMEAGVIVQTASGELQDRIGSFILKDDTLVGAWAKCYRTDWTHPVEARVMLEEYEGHKSDGTLNRQWAQKPATMIVKVAKVQAWREAFPDMLADLYDQAEIQVDTELPVKPVEDVPAENYQVGPEEEPQGPPESIPGVDKGTGKVKPPEDTEEMKSLKEQIRKDIADKDFKGSAKLEGYDEPIETEKYKREVPKLIEGYVPIDRLQHMADQIALLLLACKERDKDSPKGEESLLQDEGENV